MSTSTVCTNPGWSKSNPPAAYFHRASKQNRSTASRSDSPSSRCNTITTATILGATLRRPTLVNRSANISSGNNRAHSRCKNPYTEPDPTRPPQNSAVEPNRPPCGGANPNVTTPPAEPATA